ncbi:hypothetical protein [Mycolicibacterium phocaicum]|uniref:Uncharacterized protein n=1 Tax=Mycolicibacterium phocaicum TaxID=319706 RepID=A0AA94RH92_9MYCO|nr:hypothetical protein [Mycolicibacterium phocaicum]TLH73675.1 hypothetical protein C1S79_04630 [Mycolicibacterium phocaicum]
MQIWIGRVSLAVSVLALGLAVASLLHTANWHVNANAVSAAGSFLAAAVALWIATSDRRLRKKDRDDADFTQAKLVIVWTVRRTEQPPWLQVMVRNKGSRPILDVTFVRLSVEDHDFLLPAPADNPLPVVDPNGDGNFIFYASDDLDDAFRRALLGVPYPPGMSVAGANQLKDKPTIVESTKFTATVQFTDANGNRWEKTASNPPMEQELPVRVGGRR